MSHQHIYVILDKIFCIYEKSSGTNIRKAVRTTELVQNVKLKSMLLIWMTDNLQEAFENV